MCFEFTTSTILLNSNRTGMSQIKIINWMVCINETKCVFFAVRTGSLYIIQVTCFVWNWEQTANISLNSINWLVCITDTECVYCAVRTGSLYMIQVMCFVWISEQTAIISLNSINWLVCITDTKCLLRGTDWIFTNNSGYVFCVDMRTNSDYFPIRH